MTLDVSMWSIHTFKVSQTSTTHVHSHCHVSCIVISFQGLGWGQKY